jgi:hypothetical protein
VAGNDGTDGNDGATGATGATGAAGGFGHHTISRSGGNSSPYSIQNSSSYQSTGFASGVKLTVNGNPGTYQIEGVLRVTYNASAVLLLAVHNNGSKIANSETGQTTTLAAAGADVLIPYMAEVTIDSASHTFEIRVRTTSGSSGNLQVIEWGNIIKVHQVG